MMELTQVNRLVSLYCQPFTSKFKIIIHKDMYTVFSEVVGIHF